MVLMELRVLDHDVVGVMIHSFHLRVLMEYLDYCDDVRVESFHGHEMEEYYCVSTENRRNLRGDFQHVDLGCSSSSDLQQWWILQE